MQPKIRRRRMRQLIRVYTVCINDLQHFLENDITGDDLQHFLENDITGV